MGKEEGSKVMSSWQHGIISILRNSPTQEALSEMLDALPQSSTPSHILLEALHNYFSYRNPSFRDNWWEFRGTNLVLIIDRNSIRFAPEDDPLAKAMTNRLSSAIPRSSWARTFLHPQPK